MKRLFFALLLGLVCPGALLAADRIEVYPVLDPAAVKAMPEHHGLVRGSHDVELAWARVDLPDVAGFRILGARADAPDGKDALLAEVTGPDAVSARIGGLMVGTAYRFTVAAVDGDGTVLAVSDPVVGITAANAYPWADDLEGTLDDWDTAGSQWALTDSWSSSPTHSFTDSPDSNYQNATGRKLVTAVNLMTAQKPVLVFKQFYNILTDGDAGLVEVSTDAGSNWAVVGAVTGSSGGWLTERIDLSPYRGNLNLQIRWRLLTGTSGVSDGWYVDDVSVAETPYPVLSLPVYDNVNNAAHSDSLWFDAAWQRRTGGSDPGYCFDDSPWTPISDYLTSKLTLVNDVDLSSATHPWLVFQHKVDLAFQNFAKVEASIDGGANWSVLRTWTGPVAVADWTQVVVDLSAYAGGYLRLRFHLQNQGVNDGGGWELDKIQIQDVPETLALSLTANNSTRADLGWTAYSGGDFGSYEVYRSTTGDFLLDKDLVGTITASGTTILQDPVDAGTAYYYQVFVANTEGRYLGRSQILHRPAFALPVSAYPYVTDLESGGSEFMPGGTWALTTETANSGATSWSDSPGGNYANGTQHALTLQVDLAGGAATRPALAFWHQYGFESNADFGYLDVSTDGGATFVPIYVVTGTSGGWEQADMDLTSYRGQVLQVRWRVATSGSGQADGWHVDDIVLAENMESSPVYPLVDDFNDTAVTQARWLAGSFDLVTPSDNGTAYWTNRPAGGLADLYPGATSLVLGRPLDLSGAVEPQLRFRYRAFDNPYNTVETYLQASTDEGNTWTTLLRLGDSTSWTTAQVSMDTYGGAPSVLLRFHSYDYENGGASPWCDIEDFSLTDQPQDVTISLADNQPYEATLGWDATADPDFARYVIKYGTSPNLTVTSNTLTEITAAGTTSYVHSGLSPYDVYYYKVFVYDTQGVSSDGSNEITRPVLEPVLLSYPFNDDLEGGAGNFLADLPWAPSTETAHSGSWSWSDSPGANYANSLTSSFVFEVDLDGGAAVRPELSFWHQYGLQTGADYGFVDVSTDGGASYAPVYYVTGTSGQWRHARIDLTDYRGQILTVRFRLKTDASVQDDGWHVDDIALGESVLPDPGYPFFEDFDDSLAVMAQWVPGGFGLKGPGRDGSPYVTNRPSGYLPDYYPGATILGLGGDLDLSAAVHPQAHLWYRGYDNPYNSAQTYLQISQDGGETWTTLRHFGLNDAWTEAQIDLAAYASPVPVQLRLYAYDGESGGSQPYFDVDDFTITETPADVTVTLTDNQAYQATFSWTSAPAPGFGSYILKYGSSPNLTLSSATLATLTGAADTTFTHTGLSPYDTFYYKVFVKDAVGLLSGGSNEIARTPLQPPLLAYPFDDDMESGGDNFLTESPWAVTAETAHGGVWSWSDSPGGNYANNTNSSLVMRVDLGAGGAFRPVLAFWHRYGFETNADFGYVDVSTDGGASWIPVYSVTGSCGSWQKAEVDLTSYRGQVLQLRFRMKTGSSGQADGWHIDDIALGEVLPAPVAYPFHDAMNDSAVTRANWIPGGFVWTAPSGDGTSYWSNRATGALPDLYPGGTIMALRGSLMLAGAVHPQLSFRYRGYDSPYNSANNDVQVSQDGGANWITVKQLGNAADWTYQQVDLTGYVGMVPTLLRFSSYDGESGGSNPYLDLDDVGVSEKPGDVTLAVTDNQEYQATLTWTTPAVPGGFAGYEIKRSATAGITSATTTLAVITDPADTTFTDTGLSPNQNFYYKVFVRDAVGLISDGSNEVARLNLAPPLLAYPFSDDLEGGDGNFLPELPWELTDESAHSGSYSWSDSPHDNYANSLSLSLGLRVDMSGGAAQYPELSFWHLYGFQTNADWGRIEVSTDAGVSWSAISYVTGSSGVWKKERVDLTPYRGNVLWLRFRLSSDGSGQADGWHVDDVTIAERTDAAPVFPFYATFDDSAATAAQWLTGGFERISPSDNGSAYLSDQPTGACLNFYPGSTDLALGGELDLTGSANPVLQLRYRAYNNAYNSAETYLQVSSDGGGTWATLGQLANVSVWTVARYSLASYQGEHSLLLRARAYDGDSGSANPWCDVEDLAVTEAYDLTPMADFCRLDYPERIWLSAGQTSSVITGRVHEPGVTDAAGQGAGVRVQLGWGPAGTMPMDPASAWIFSDAVYAGDADGATVDLYQGHLVAGAVGQYDYCFRTSLNDGDFWLYADLDGNTVGQGAFDYYERAQAGRMVVTVAPDMVLSATAVELSLPVGQVTSRVLTVGNEGVGPLAFAADEATAPPAPAEVTWLSVAPAEGTVQPQAFAQLAIAIDGTNLSEGDYTATVMLYSNDPGQPRLDIPVTVHMVPPSAPHVSGTVLDVDFAAPQNSAFVELYSGTALIGQATAGGNGYFSIFGVPAGTYQIRAHSEGYYPVTAEVTAPVSDVALVLHRVPYFTPTNTNVNFYGELSYLDGELLRKGDVVTVQDQDGIVCGSFDVQVAGSYGFLHAYGDDPTTPGVDEGAEPGDVLTFRVNGEPAFTMGPDTAVWTGDGDIRQVELSAVTVTVDRIPLNAGWNLVSFNRAPLDDAVAVVLEDQIASGNLVIAYGFDQQWGGAVTYDPLHPELSDLDTMDPQHGYWLKVTAPDTLAVDGAMFWPDNPLILEGGWNLTSYLPEESRGVVRALGSIDGAYSLVSGFEGGALTYDPLHPEFSTLEYLRNGFGYWLKMDYSAELVYDQGGAKSGVRKLDDVVVLDLTPTPWWDSFYGVANMEGTPLQVGETIRAIDPDGVICGTFVCRQQGIYGYMPIYGDDPTTPEDEGATAGDRIIFAYGPAGGMQTPPEITWRGDQSLVQFDLDFLTGADDGAGDLPRQFAVHGAHPNPFNPMTEISYDLPRTAQVEVAVFDVAGRLITRLVDGVQEAGRKTVRWRGQDDAGRPVATGVYFCRVRSGGETGLTKMLLIK